MQLGMIGLGRMGANIVRRLMRDGHTCVVCDVSPDSVAELEKEGATGAATMEEFVAKLDKPRVAWVMIPAGITGKTVEELGDLLEAGDIIIDGGNSNYRDDVDRAAALREKGIHYVDIGTSGGVFGLERGYCLMIGGSDEAVAQARSAAEDHRARARRHRPHPGSGRRTGAGGAGLPALRAVGRGSLREDGPQRHRVRHHGRLRRGAEHPQQRRRRHPGRGALGRGRPARRARVLPVRHRHAQGRRGVAAGQRHRVLAARPDRCGPPRPTPAWPGSPVGCRTPARAGGR